MDWAWQFVFPSSTISRDPRSGRHGRHHLHESAVSREITAAVSRSGIAQRATSHTFRHSIATHLLESGDDIRTIQELLGHSSVETTMIDTHVLNTGNRGVQSPLDVGFPVSPTDQSAPVHAPGAMLTSRDRLRDEHRSLATENSPEYNSPSDIMPISAMRHRWR